MTARNKSARSSGNYPTPKRQLWSGGGYSVADFRHDHDRYADYVKACDCAAIIIGLAFGLMFFIGVMLGW